MPEVVQGCVKIANDWLLDKNGMALYMALERVSGGTKAVLACKFDKAPNGEVEVKRYTTVPIGIVRFAMGVLNGETPRM